MQNQKAENAALQEKINEASTPVNDDSKTTKIPKPKGTAVTDYSI
jgi:hypothetical protein